MTGMEALQALRGGRQVRCARWTPGCWVMARYIPEVGMWTMFGSGTQRFCRDVQESQGWIVSDLLSDAEWQVREEGQDG